MRTFLIVITLFLYETVFAQSASDIQAYIAKYKQIALEQEQRFGVPASITLAQGILESGAGTSALTRNANNHFGIKAFGGWTGGVYLAWDDETHKSRFRVYGSAADSFKDHSVFLKNNSRYSFLFSKSVYDYRAWAIGLQNAGYATAGNYAKALIGFIDAYRLYAINGGVKLRAGKTVVVKRYITKEKPVFEDDCQMDDAEESEEQAEVANAVNKYVVDINDVRCTVLLPGQSLSQIATKYEIPKYKLLEYNEVANENDIKEGDIVFLAKKRSKYFGAKDYYRAKTGDTLYSISQMFGIRLNKLLKMNDKDFFSIVKDGDIITLK